MFQWDAEKDRANRAKHGVGLSLAERFGWDDALITVDTRFDYGETRYLAYGLADDHKGYAIVFTIRGAASRIISVRRMNQKERTHYGSHRQQEEEG